jgi:hypothetical protein
MPCTCLDMGVGGHPAVPTLPVTTCENLQAHLSPLLHIHTSNCATVILFASIY